VDRSWHDFFKGFDLLWQDMVNRLFCPNRLKKNSMFLRLIDDYRKRGHLFTQTNPVRSRRKYSPTLALENYGLTKRIIQPFFMLVRK
jgi:2-oxoglutarate dehydrogenase E1 component